MKNKSKLSNSQNMLEMIYQDSSGAHTRYRLKRRDFLKTSAVLGTAAVTGIYAPAIIASDRSIKVATYGGYFENAFIDHIFPEFRKSTGIKVESVTQPPTEVLLTTIEQATKAGVVTADVTVLDQFELIRGNNINGLFQSFDLAKIKNIDHINNSYLYRKDEKEGPVGIGAMAWYLAMVVNTDRVSPMPESWADFWSPTFADNLGVNAIYRGGLLDITAATFFDGINTLSTKEGILEVINKVSELKPNVKLWWNTFEPMEMALQNEEIIGGTYYPDVISLMAADGFPVTHLFPKEGNPMDYGSWVLSALSDKVDEAHEFVSFSCDPATQALMTRKVGTAPLVERSKTDLTDEEFFAISSEKSPILMAHKSYLKYNDFIKENWDKMLTA